MTDTKLDTAPQGGVSYAQRLVGAEHDLPHCARLLARAQQNRETRLAALARGRRLRGLDQLSEVLATYSAAYRSDGRLARMAFLVTRVEAHFAVALEASLSGMHSVVHDEMRGVMEIEFLLRDFAITPAMSRNGCPRPKSSVERNSTPRNERPVPRRPLLLGNFRARSSRALQRTRLRKSDRARYCTAVS